MPFKDPAKHRAYVRQWQREKRAGKSTGLRVKLANSPEEIRTASALLTVLAELIKEVIETPEGDVFIRARTAGYLISIGLRAVEVADLESRITNLENKIIGGQK